MPQRVDQGIDVIPLVEREQVLEELQESYAKLSDNTYADLPEEVLLEMLNEARRKYREEELAKAQTSPVF
ncbi:MAG: hypothetical protein HQK99_12300 [Nitrospirae bacterium]|nr:hypothetical protein [Nitrospirota bacterium]